MKVKLRRNSSWHWFTVIAMPIPRVNITPSLSTLLEAFVWPLIFPFQKLANASRTAGLV